MADYENPAYTVTITQGTGDSSVSYIFKFDETLRNQPINSILNTNGVYCGENAPQSVLTSYSTLKFDGLGSDIKNQEWHLLPHKVEGTCNMRIFGVWQTSLTAIRTAFRWTGLDDDFVTDWNNLPLDYQATGANIPDHYNPLTNSSTGTSYSVGIGINTIYQYTPLLNLKFRSIILYPVFHFVTQTITRKDNGYLYYNSGDGAVNSYSWADIKPADKTPKGQYYDDIAPLFTNKYRIVSTSGNSVTIQYCAGVTVTPYIGESNKIYNSQTDAYENETGEVVYTDRQPFSGRATTGDSHPAVNSALGIAFLCEYYVPELKSVIYATPAGVMFGGYGSRTSTINQSFAFGINYQTKGTGSAVDSVHPYFNPSSSYMEHQYNTVINANANTVDEVAMISERTEGSNPYIVLPGTHLNSSGVFSSVFEGSNSTVPTSANANSLKQVNGNESEVFPYMRGYGNYFNPQCVDGYTINELWATIAGFGVFVAADLETAQVANLNTIYSNNRLYCGYMDSNFVTDGRMIQGDDIYSLPQRNIEDLIRETPFEPVNPNPTPVPSDDDIDDDFDKNLNFGGNFSLGYADLSLVGSFSNFVTMGRLSIQTLRTKLQEATDENFWQYLGVRTTEQNGDNIITRLTTGEPAYLGNYILSLRQYPFSVSNTMLGTGVTNDILKFGYKGAALDGISHMTVPTPICLLDFGSVSVPYMQGNKTTFYDYEPYTNATIFIPGMGEFSINCSFCVGRTLKLIYVIDLTTGIATAVVTATDTEGNTIEVLCQSASIGVNIGIQGNDIYAQSANMAAAYGNTYRAGKQSLKDLGSQLKEAGGNFKKMTATSLIKGTAQTAESILDFRMNLRDLQINDSLASRDVPNIITAGSGIGSNIGVKQAYIRLERPFVEVPENYGKTVGYLWNGYSQIGNLSGWTVCQNVDTSGINCTNEERKLIKAQMEAGFYA